MESNKGFEEAQRILFCCDFHGATEKSEQGSQACNDCRQWLVSMVHQNECDGVLVEYHLIGTTGEKKEKKEASLLVCGILCTTLLDNTVAKDCLDSAVNWTLD